MLLFSWTRFSGYIRFVFMDDNVVLVCCLLLVNNKIKSLLHKLQPEADVMLNQVP